MGTVGLDVPAKAPLFATLAPGALDEVERRLDAGEFDLVAVGRALLADAAWAEKIHHGRATADGLQSGGIGGTRRRRLCRLASCRAARRA